LNAVGASVSVNNGPAGLGAVAWSNDRGEAIFAILAREPGAYRLVLTAEKEGRSEIPRTTLMMDWTRSALVVPPLIDAIGRHESAVAFAETLFPITVPSGTAVVACDPALDPKLTFESVALAHAVHGPLLFANPQGGLSAATITSLLRLKVSRVITVGNLHRSTMGLPNSIAIMSTVAAASTDTMFLNVAESAVAYGGIRYLVVTSTQSSAMVQVAAASFASHRRAGLLLVRPGALSPATLRFVEDEKVVWIIGSNVLPKLVGPRPPIRISGQTSLQTVFQVDQLDHTGPQDLVAFNQDDRNPLLEAMTAELAASWPATLIPVENDVVAPLAQHYLSIISHESLQNLFLENLPAAVGTALQDLLRSGR